jgi:gamma-glutamylcyclotransferase (GGCT)/AIG2-like uncharacterized protein YtfP
MAATISSHNVFVYGSLMADEVVSVLLERVPPSVPAVLPGYQRHSIKGRVYPAIVPAEEKRVIGKVLFDLMDNELEILDEFEDVEYNRVLGEVFVLDNERQQIGSNQLKAHAYVWANVDDKDLYGEWDFEEWKNTHMNDFLNMSKSFISDFRQSPNSRRVPIYETLFEHSTHSEEI